MRTVRIVGGLLVVASALLAGAGCSSPAAVEESQQSSASKLSACQLVGAATTASVSVAVMSTTATGVCAETAAAATVVSGGVAAPGGIVCLAPAGAAAVSGLVAILGAGVTMLVCGDQQSQVTAANSDAPAATTDDSASSNGRTCDDDTYRQLAAAKDQACNSLPSSCTNFSAGGSMTSSFCVGLQLRQGEYQKCLSARQDVINQCFGGVPTDQEHQDQLDTMQREVDACQQQLDGSCNGSANQPSDDQDPDDSGE